MFLKFEPRIWFFLLIFTLSGVKVKGELVPLTPAQPLEGTKAAPGSLWPLPQEWQSSSNLVSIGTPQDFNYVLNVESCEPLEWAFGKYNHEFLFGTHSAPDSNFPIFKNVFVNVANSADSNLCQNFPQFSRDQSYESYTLNVAVDHENFGYAVIDATTVWGALRGLESFSQLWFTNDWESETRHFYINVTTVNDWPRFPHRGMLIDTARHYQPVSTIVQVLDAMMYNKFNVLHWHITDDQSFPFVSTTFPELSGMGAYSPKHVYTPTTVTQVMNEARLRGIRVLLEFDTPGHTHAMGNSHLELLTPCYGDGETPGTPDYPNHAAYQNLDPTRETTYEFMRDLFTEIYDIAEDDYLHLGMDEVYYECWNSSLAIKEFMVEQGYTELNEVQAHYTNRHLEMISSLGAKSIIWQDPIDEGVSIHSEVMVEMWKDWGEGGWTNWTQQVLDMGYEVIISSPWYLNYIDYGQTWRQYYEVDLVYDIPDLKPGQEDQILGGEVCMWGEYVDKTNLIPRLFPFSNAVGERLWSAPNSSSTDDAMWRLDEHRCRMLWRGIAAQPILQGYCGSWEVDNDR